jgi:hypothetical protein
MPKATFDAGFGTKAVTDRFNAAAAKLTIPAKNPIPYTPFKFDTSVYSRQSLDISSMALVY